MVGGTPGRTWASTWPAGSSSSSGSARGGRHRAGDRERDPWRGDLYPWAGGRPAPGSGGKEEALRCAERKRIAPFVQEFASHFDMDGKALLDGDYTRIGPASARPFASKYTWSEPMANKSYRT